MNYYMLYADTGKDRTGSSCGLFQIVHIHIHSTDPKINQNVCRMYNKQQNIHI
jgi:hypothetical protein